jgi:ABC-type multidrug transport system fused ATPase/permease subunit
MTSYDTEDLKFTINDDETAYDINEEEELDTNISAPMISIDTRRPESELEVFNAQFSVQIDKKLCGLGKGKKKTIISDVSVKIRSGRLCCILGPSGYFI